MQKSRMSCSSRGLGLIRSKNPLRGNAYLRTDPIMNSLQGLFTDETPKEAEQAGGSIQTAVAEQMGMTVDPMSGQGLALAGRGRGGSVSSHRPMGLGSAPMAGRGGNPLLNPRSGRGLTDIQSGQPALSSVATRAGTDADIPGALLRKKLSAQHRLAKRKGAPTQLVGQGVVTTYASSGMTLPMMKSYQLSDPSLPESDEKPPSIRLKRKNKAAVLVGKGNQNFVDYISKSVIPKIKASIGLTKKHMLAPNVVTRLVTKVLASVPKKDRSNIREISKRLSEAVLHMLIALKMKSLGKNRPKLNGGSLSSMLGDKKADLKQKLMEGFIAAVKQFFKLHRETRAKQRKQYGTGFLGKSDHYWRVFGRQFNRGFSAPAKFAGTIFSAVGLPEIGAPLGALGTFVDKELGHL